MNYDEWISRERRIRVRILQDSPQITKSRLYRVCQDCGEICLCHEQTCPNCSKTDIREQLIDDLDSEVQERIRCLSRFENLLP